MNVKLIEASKLDAAVTSAIKASGTLSKRLHAILCTLHTEVIEHGDIRQFVRLVDGLENGAVKVNAVREWISKYTPVEAVVDDNGKFVEYKLDKDERTRQASARAQFVDAGMAEPFWKMASREGEEYKPMVMESVLRAFIKRLQKDATETKSNHSNLITALTNAQDNYETV